MLRIEEALKQKKPFRSTREKVIVNLIYTHAWARSELQDFFSQFDLTGQQFNVLRILRGAESPISTSEIRERMVEKMSDSSRIVDRLEQKGLVEKSQCKKDKRLVDITITQLGLQLLKKIDSSSSKIESIAGKLTLKEIDTLNTLLDKLRS